MFQRCYSPKNKISIHALLAESDFKKLAGKASALLFLSTLSLRRATLGAKRRPCMGRDFYPRSPCGERLVTALCSHSHPRISIHALLAESDQSLQRQRSPHRHFYPRSPCGERPECPSLLPQ